MAALDYTYLLTDLMSGKVLSDAIAFSLSSYARQLNNSSDCSGTLDLSDDAVRRLSDPIAATEPRRTALWVIRDTQLVWGGIIWTRRYRSADYNLELTASTPESYFARRRIRDTLTYNQVDQHAIIAALVNNAQARAYGNIGIRVPATSSSGRLRDRTFYWHERATYLERMQQLSEVIDGPDWTMTPDWVAQNTPGWYLNIGTPLGVTRVGNELEFPGDFRNYSWPDDGGNSANFWSAIGDPDANDVPRIRDAQMPAEWQAGIPLLEDVSDHSGVSQVDTLTSYAQANVRANAGNRTVPEGTLRLMDASDIPQPGDRYRLRITDPYRFPPNPITGAPGLVTSLRITAWTVNVSAEEGETITLTFEGGG